MSIKAIVFDVDGTLAETEALHRRAFNQAFAEAGLDWHWDQRLYGRLLKVTGGKERILAHIRDGLGREPDAADDALVRALHARKTAIYTAAVSSGALALRPGIAELVAGARKCGVRLAIATTTSLPNVQSLLVAAFGPRGQELFEAVAAGDVVQRKKPAPDIYLLALNMLGLAAADCLALEDSRNGLLSARGAGIATLVTPSAFTQDESFDGAVAIGSDLLRLVVAHEKTSPVVHELARLIGAGMAAGQSEA